MSRVESAEAVSEHVSRRRWLAVVAVAVGTFLVVTAEQLPVGLLTSIGGDLGVSEGTAGLMVTVPGLVASAGALLVPVAIGRLDRRAVLLGLISLMVVANLLSFLAPNFPVLLASRFLVGISIGGFWALAAGIAVRLVPSEAATALNTVVFNLAIALGALFGGLVVYGASATAVLWFGAALSVLTFLAVWTTRRV